MCIDMCVDMCVDMCALVRQAISCETLPNANANVGNIGPNADAQCQCPMPLVRARMWHAHALTYMHACILGGGGTCTHPRTHAQMHSVQAHTYALIHRTALAATCMRVHKLPRTQCTRTLHATCRSAVPRTQLPRQRPKGRLVHAAITM